MYKQLHARPSHSLPASFAVCQPVSSVLGVVLNCESPVVTDVFCAQCLLTLCSLPDARMLCCPAVHRVLRPPGLALDSGFPAPSCSTCEDDGLFLNVSMQVCVFLVTRKGILCTPMLCNP